MVVSSSVVIVISVFSGVTVSDLARLGYVPFVLAAVVSSSKLLVQAVRFRVIATGLAKDSRPDMSGVTLARMGSEFVALSTPSMVGGEFVRAAWLSGKGVTGGKALWIGYFEGVVDVYVSSALGFISAAYAFSRGATVLASTIFVVVLLLVIGYSVFFLIPALRGIKVPGRLFRFAGLFIRRAESRTPREGCSGGFGELFAGSARSTTQRRFAHGPLCPRSYRHSSHTIWSGPLDHPDRRRLENRPCFFNPCSLRRYRDSRSSNFNRWLRNHRACRCILPVFGLRILLVGGHRAVEGCLFSGRAGGNWNRVSPARTQNYEGTSQDPQGTDQRPESPRGPV